LDANLEVDAGVEDMPVLMPAETPVLMPTSATETCTRLRRDAIEFFSMADSSTLPTALPTALPTMESSVTSVCKSVCNDGV
jgi:hypothetical protein